MIHNVIKSDGTKVPFNPEKLNQWAEWASHYEVDWSGIVLDAVSKLHDECNTRDIQMALINACTDRFDEKSFKLAGRILIGVVYKEAFGSFHHIPTLSQHYSKMLHTGYWVEMDYSEDELEKLNAAMVHSRDLNLGYTEIKQINDKYLTRNRVENITLESPQFMYMGMAMANMERMPKSRRMQDVLKLYHYLSVKAINAPTPFMCFLRTPHRNYASCCVSTCNDTIDSLDAQDSITYKMTAASAGIGAHLMTRSKGDPVRGGTVIHQGKRGYINRIQASVKANLQNARGGAATIHLNALDPEIFDLLTLRSIKTPLEKRIAGINYSFGYSRLLAKKVAKDETWMLISYHVAPDLWDAMYSSNEDLFDTLYMKYEASGAPKKFVSAKELVLESLVQGQETGGVYQHNIYEMNHHTPFKDTIYSSNLCVAPETLVLTDKGHKEISTLKDQTVNVWNGEEFSSVVVRQTGENKKLLSVTTSSGQGLDCTPLHNFYVVREYGQTPEKVAAKDLKVGDNLMKFTDLPVIQGGMPLEDAYLNGFYSGDGCYFERDQIVYLYGEKRKLVDKLKTPACRRHSVQDRRDREILVYRNLKDKFFVPDSGYTLESRLSWLAGYLDADGCIHRNGTNSAITACSVEFDFLARVQLMLQTMGINAKVLKGAEAGLRPLPANDGTGELKDFQCKAAWRLIITSFDSQRLLNLGLKFNRLVIEKRDIQRDARGFSTVVSVEDFNRSDDTYCFTESLRGLGVFNGILTGQCQEIGLPTKGYTTSDHLSIDGESSGEIGLCSLAAVVAGRVEESEYEELYYYTLLMVDNVIDLMDYPFKNLAFTAKARRSVGIGVTNLANDMANRGLKYSSAEGKQYIHRLMEMHSFYLHKASLQLAKERGVCDWMDRTKYPDGWLPIDTYNKNVDKVVKQGLLCDWESLRAEIIKLGGIRNSVLEAFMPNESSSLATDGTNSILPTRSLKIIKTNDTKTVKSLVPDSDRLADQYEIAWDIPSGDLIDVYAIVQKFCGQAISADLYLDFKDGKIPASRLLNDWLRMTMLGVKTRYYMNSRTKTGSKEQVKSEPELVEDTGCASGGCTL